MVTLEQSAMKIFRIFVGCLLAFGQAKVQAAQYAYVTDLDYSDLSADVLAVLDTETNTFVAAIPLGGWAWDVAVNPALGLVYVDIYGGEPQVPGVIVVVNALTNQVGTLITGTAPNPHNPVVNSAGTRLYVEGQNGAISVIDTASNSVVATMQGGPNGLAVNPSGTRLYSVTSGTPPYPGFVTVFDTATNTAIGPPIDVGLGPASIAVDPTGTRAYVVNDGFSGIVTVIDLATNTVASTIAVSVDNASAYPEQVLFNATGTRAYVKTGGAFGDYAQIVVIDTATQAVVARTQIPARTNGAGIDPEGTFIYVALGPGDPTGPSIFIYDTTAYTITANLETPPGANPGARTIAAAVMPQPPNSAYCPVGNVLTKPDAIYTQNNNQGVVTDNTTGLMWAECSEGQSGAGCTGTATTMAWNDALTDAAASNLGGYSDWRLPNEKELESLLETGCYDPSINRNVFPSTEPHPYWSSTTYTYDPSHAWYVDFGGAINANYPDYKSVTYYVRLVRGGQALDGFDKQGSYTPSVFSFAAQTGVPVNSPITSNTISLSGLTTSTGISITGGHNAEYSINGGPYTANPGAVINGNTLSVQQTSAGSGNTTTTVTLTVGGVSADFSVTTGALADPIFASGFD